MASKKITAMPDLAGGQVPTDLLTAVDLSASLANQNVKSTLNDLFAEITKNITDLSVQFGNGAAATVSAAGKGKLIYNNSVQSFQASENGAAYQNLLKGSGTAQQVAFFTAAAALGGDTAFVWDSTNNRLGIGVTVAASVTSLNVRADGSAIAAEFLPNTVSDNPRVQIQVTSSDGRIGTSNATPSPFYIITNNTERISVESGGAVAINRTSPAQAQLHVDAATNVTTAFLANNAAGSSVEIAVFQVNGGNRALLTENGEWILGNASSVSGKLTLANSAGATLTSISAGNAASTLNFIWPIVDPTAGQVLSAAAPSGSDVVLSWVANGSGAPPTLTATQIGFGDGSNQLSGSTRLIWDNTNRAMTLGESGNAGSTFITLRSSNSASAFIAGSAAVAPGSQGGLLMANVGGDQTQGPGITWSDGNYNGTSRLYLSLGLNWQGYDTGGQALRLRKTTATSSQGDVVFEFRPNDGYLQINPFGTSAGNTTEVRFLELAASGTNYVALRGPDAVGATNPVIVLPSSSAPSTNDVLTVTGVSSGIITTAWQAGGGGGISGSGTTGAIAKFTGATAIGDSIITESSTTITVAGRETINGLTISADANNTVASLTSNWSLTKNDTNTRNFYGALFQPTLNAGGANTATTVNVLAVNTTNTSLTGLTVNLLNLAFGGTEKFNVDSAGAVTFASGVRQAFAPDATNPGLNVGVVSGDPSSPVDGDLWYDSTGNLLRARINSATVSLGAGGGSPGGSNTQIQYNNSSAFGGISTLTTDGTIVTFTPTVTTGSGSTAGVVGVANSLTTGNAFDFSSSSVTSGNVFSIAATGTAAASNTKTALRVATSGANGTSTQTTYGGRFSNTSTGTASTNVGLDVSASGGTNNFGLIVSGGQLLTQLGTQAAPGLVIGTAVTSTGFYGNGTRIQISIANVVGPLINGAGLYSKAAGIIGWDSSTDPANGTTDSAIGRNAAGRLEINNGTASAYRDLIVRQYYADQTITPGGTTGNQTINKSAGTVNIAAAGTTVTVTCSLCTTSSTIYTALRTNDATARIANVVPGAGSFVITLTAAATAEVSIGFLVVNQ